MIRHWKLSAAIALVMLASSCVGAYQETYVRASYRSPGTAVSMSYFYDEMAPYGRWVDYQPYGWCWTPYDASPGWRPYSDGYWVYTEFGWTWASSEPWGWAAYHYGRWTFDRDYGWVWIPGTTWGPAWVAWSYGEDWVGWAPLGPGIDISIRVADYDRIPDQQWCFVERQHFTDGNLRPWVVSSARNRTLLSRTRALARVDEGTARAQAQGPDVSLVERWTGRRIERNKVVDVESPSRGRGRSVGGGAVGFFRPPIREKDPREAPPPSVQQREVAIPEPELRRQQVEERRKLESSLAQERARLDREQAQELRFQPPGTKLDEIRAKHAAEKRAFEGQAAEQRDVLEKRIQKKIVKPERAKNVKPEKDKDNDRQKKKGDRGEG
jgi:hypothetical protein